MIPFTETIFLWQSMVITARADRDLDRDRIWSAPCRRHGGDGGGPSASTSASDEDDLPPPQQPGEWLEYSPLLTVLLVAARGGWLIHEFTRQSTHDRHLEPQHLQFPVHHARLLLHWRPKRFLVAVAKSVPATAGVLIQFPFYGAIAAS